MDVWCNALFSYAESSCDPKRWERYFLNFNPSDWEKESGGVLQYLTDTSLKYALMVSYWKNLGFLLQYSCDDLKAHKQVCCRYAVADSSALDRFEERDELVFPTGCFLAPTAAWLAVEDFLNNPKQPSRRVEWVDDEAIPWPEL
jgi:hypothetical protein